MSKPAYKTNRFTTDGSSSKEKMFSTKGSQEKPRMNASYHKFPIAKKPTEEEEPAVIGGQRKMQIIQFNPTFSPLEVKTQGTGSLSEPSYFCEGHPKIKVR